MRLLNYLTEDIDVQSLLKNNRIVDLYKKHNKFFYRGKKSPSIISEYQVFNRRKDRRPMDMPSHLHKDFDIEFQKKFSWKSRSEGVFAVAASYVAQLYGTPYVFIPIEPFRYIYSLSITDLYREIKCDHFYITYEEALILKSPKLYSKEEYQKIINKIVNSYRKDNIAHALMKTTEVMFDCDRYLLINSTYINDFMEKL